MLLYEQPLTAGIDEAGRGPLAGPVVACACIIPCPMFRRRRSYGAWSPHRRAATARWVIADSKALSAEQREAAFTWIVEHCPFGIGHASAEDIDRIGVRAATHRAMQDALAELSRIVAPEHLLVDGNDRFAFDLPSTCIVRGDDLEPEIAAASIVAKVTRDRLMRGHAETFPQFGFERHKGYGTEEHVALIRKHGPCPEHRRSFLTRVLSSFPAA